MLDATPDVKIIQGYVSPATAEYEAREARLFWIKGEQCLRSAHVIDTAHWERMRALLSPAKPTGCTPEQAAAWAQLMKNPAHPTKEQIDARDIQTRLLPYRRKARDDFKVGRGLMPYPVYVATMPDGSQQRLSFWSNAGKPMDFAAGYNVSMVIGRALPTDGYVEHDGKRWRDPHFEPQSTVTPIRKDPPAVRLAAICRALNEGEVELAMTLARAA